MQFDNRLWRFVRNLLDVHSAAGAYHNHVLVRGAVEEDRQIKFLVNIDLLGDQDFFDDHSGRVLDRDQLLTDQFTGKFCCFFGVIEKFNSAGFAPAPHQDLRFDDNRAVVKLGYSQGFFRVGGYVAAWNGYATFGEQPFGLVFVELHPQLQRIPCDKISNLFMTWTKQAIRKAVADLEALYGTEDATRGYDPLEELISCILSQHTTDATSFPTFDRLRAKYHSWEDVVSLGHAKLVKEISAAGLPNQKAKAILGSLEEIKRKYGGYTLEPLRNLSMEEARAELLALPGVGPKTAAIVLAFGFGMPAIPVDTHVFRVSWRLGIIRRQSGAAKANELVEKLVPKEIGFRFHVAFIRHGRGVCKALKPRCHQCPLRRRCEWFQEHKNSKLVANA